MTEKGAENQKQDSPTFREPSGKDACVNALRWRDFRETLKLDYNDEAKEGKMQIKKVPGRNNKHRVLMYAISTCGWCKRTKRFLKDNNIEYEYVDIDLCSREDQEKIRQNILSRGGRLSYPTIIVDDSRLITGFQEHEIREALEI